MTLLCKTRCRMLPCKVLLLVMLVVLVGYFYGQIMLEVLSSTMRSRRIFMPVNEGKRRTIVSERQEVHYTTAETVVANLTPGGSQETKENATNANATESQQRQMTAGPNITTKRAISLPTLKLHDGAIFFLDITPTSEPFTITVPTACAVESAARLNLGRKVQFLLAGDQKELAINELAEYVQTLSHVEFGRLALEDLQDGPLTTGIITKIKGMNDTGPNYFWAVNMSDLVRLLMLWKHGGFYVDADMVALKPFDRVRNAIGCQIAKNSSCVRTNMGVLSVDKHHPLVEGLLKIYDGANVTAWKNATMAYGNHILTHFFDQYCTSLVRQPVNESNFGYPYAYPPPACLKTLNLSVLPTDAFYPFWVGQCKSYFQPEDKGMVMATLKKVKPYLVHYYATYTRELVAKEEFQGTAFAELAEQYCPRAYSHWVRKSLKKGGMT